MAIDRRSANEGRGSVKLWQRHRAIDALAGLNVYDKGLLRVIANHVKDHDPRCFLSQATLQTKTGIDSTKGIRHATQRLENRGLLTVERPPKYSGRGKAIVYTLHLNIGAASTYSERQKYVPCTPKIGASRHLNSDPRSHQPINNQLCKPEPDTHTQAFEGNEREEAAEHTEATSAPSTAYPTYRCPDEVDLDAEFCRRNNPKADMAAEMERFRSFEFKAPVNDWNARWRIWVLDSLRMKTFVSEASNWR
jgi:hypothetical protein